ncbi:putative methionyl-tRNA synthetase [Hordeum vulgare]|nr:putative methionyl-tRNA synthetase [Hordeum vulgare]
MEAPPASSLALAASSLAPAASSLASVASFLPPPVAPPPALASVTPAPAQQPAIPSQAQVASMVAATHVSAKRRRAGRHVIHPQPAPAAASVVPPATSLAPPKPPATKGRKKKPSLGPKVKKTTSRKKPVPAPAPAAAPPPVVHEVLDEMSAPPTSFMGLLEDAEVDIGAPPLDPFGFGDDLEEKGDEEEEGEDEEEVIEIEEEAFAAVGKPTVRSTNYSGDKDSLLVRAWAHVGMDASTGTDETSKRYGQRIEDVYCKIKPKTGGYNARSYRSLQGRWELMKPHCARWSAAMDQVKDAPPSGTVESDHEAIADLRYKEMATSKVKAFPFKHVWKILQTYDKWKLRDQETAPKKSAMHGMDDSDEEERNECKPEGTKKDKLRKKMEEVASSIREKMEHMMKSREALTMNTLETKLLINEKKKEVKLAQVEARRERSQVQGRLGGEDDQGQRSKGMEITHGGREGAHDDVQEGHE